jgi:anti-sigma regulatory factor (Ser/Thr protein kinase)
VLRLDLESAPAVVATARRRVREHVQAELVGLAAVEDLLDDVALVVSELVTNAIVHGEPPVTLEVRAERHDPACAVVVSCSDGGPWDGTPPDPVRGRGLLLVRALSDVVITADEHGTVVRATLTR